jgi:preprotein translocase subunit SecD
VRRFLPIVILILGVVAIYVDHPGAQFIVLNNVDAGLTQPVHTKLGLDLKGGFSITYQAVVNAGQTPPTAAQMETIRSIMENRVNSTGVSEPIVETAAGDRVIVQVPGATDEQAIEKLVGKTGNLEFVLLPAATYGKYDPTTGSIVGGTGKAIPGANQPIDPTLPVQFTGKQLDTSKIDYRHDAQEGWVVDFGFSGTAATDFATWTGDHVDEYFAIVLDGAVIEAPYLKAQITGGSGTISGGFSSASDAKNLSTVLQYGALPYPMTDIPERNGPGGCDRHPSGPALHADLLPAAGLDRLHRARLLRSPGLRHLPNRPGDADAGRCGGLRALGRHGRGRQHPYFRAD